MSTSAHTTPGTIIQVDFGAGFVTIPDVTALGGPTATIEEIEVTDLSSTAKEYLPLPIDPGEISMTLQYRSDNSTHSALWDDFVAGTSRSWQLVDTASVPVTMSFTGFIKGFQIDHQLSAVRTADVTIRLSGLPTFA
jgi:hypothetical protein